MAPGIKANETRKLITISLGDGRQETMWVAPTKSGGLCVYVQRASLSGGPGCGPAEAPVGKIEWGLQGRAEHDNAFVIYGRVPDAAVDLDLRYADGATARLPLTKGFFLWEIPEARVARGARPASLTAHDSQGDVVGHTVIPAWLDTVFDDAAP